MSRRDDSIKICVTVPAHKYDELYRRAARADVSVPEFIRRSLHIKTSRSE
jgi:hypothetical protein